MPHVLFLKILLVLHDVMTRLPTILAWYSSQHYDLMTCWFTPANLLSRSGSSGGTGEARTPPTAGNLMEPPLSLPTNLWTKKGRREGERRKKNNKAPPGAQSYLRHCCWAFTMHPYRYVGLAKKHKTHDLFIFNLNSIQSKLYLESNQTST